MSPKTKSGGKARLSAPAKINIHLEVHARRPDGFHDLRSIFQMISICDEVSVEVGGRGFMLEGAFDCPARENTIFKAWQVFRSRTGVRRGVRVRVDKRVPSGAGMGGGSSNAAAALRLFDQIFATGLSAHELASLGACVGSDVPFFCLAATALIEGRGERVLPIEPRCDFAVLAAVPTFSVDTRAAYAWLDEAGNFPPPSDRSMLCRAYRELPPRDWPFFNSFEAVLRVRHPLYADLNARLRNHGAHFCAVSGSGSGFFAVFPDHAAASRAKEALGASWRLLAVAHPLDRMPAAVVE